MYKPDSLRERKSGSKTSPVVIIVLRRCEISIAHTLKQAVTLQTLASFMMTSLVSTI